MDAPGHRAYSVDMGGEKRRDPAGIVDNESTPLVAA
jgi:hypothetical protein